MILRVFRLLFLFDFVKIFIIPNTDNTHMFLNFVKSITFRKVKNCGNLFNRFFLDPLDKLRAPDKIE